MGQEALAMRRYLEDTDYLLPKDAEEDARLNFQHYALLHAIGNHYVAPLGPSVRLVLEVGAGTGIWASEMARLFPQAEVIGIDIDPALFRAPAQLPENCLLRTGNVLTGLPFPDGIFSFTHQRLLVAAIPAGKWPGVVRELVRVTQPGGWVEIVEIDSEIERPGPATVKMHELSAVLVDGEPIRHLDRMMRQAGLQDVETTRIPIPLGEWGGRVGSMMKRDLLSACDAFKGICVQRGLINPQEYDQMTSDMANEWEQLQSACVFYAVYGRQPAE
jgi:SAM-dependent methyltransferase